MNQSISTHSSQRHNAAGALHEARARLACHADAGNACGWALAMLPDRRAAQRLMLDWLLHTGQHEEVITRTGALLMHESNVGANFEGREAHRSTARDAALWLRRADALDALGRSSEALDAIDRALASRPHHRRSLLIKARILTNLNADAAALSVLELADAQHPHHREVACRLVESLLACDRADDAMAILEQMPAPPAEWRARALAAQGRLLDARLALEDAILWELAESRRDDLRVMHIELLEQIGDWPTLRALMRAALASDQLPESVSEIVASRLAEACLPMGGAGIAAIASDSSESPCHSEPEAPAMPVIAPASARSVHAAAAAHALAGREDEALALLSTPRAASDDSAATRLQPWLRALLGMVVADQIDPRRARRAGADPSISVLETILPAAIATFESALADASDSPHASIWQAMRDDCERAALQRDIVRDADFTSPSVTLAA